jgi:hypothetical protein
MADAKKPKQRKVTYVTPVGVAAYSYFHKPDTGGTYSDNKYKGDLILPGDTDLSKLEDLCKDFCIENFPKAPRDEIQLPFKSGDDHKNEEFHGKLILKAKSQYAPQVVDSKKKRLPKGVFARAGDEVRFVTTLYAYETTETVKEGGKKKTVTLWGVSLQLTVVQVITKNAGGGGLNELDEIDGYDASEDGEPWDGESNSSEDDADSNGGDF